MVQAVNDQMAKLLRANREQLAAMTDRHRRTMLSYMSQLQVAVADTPAPVPRPSAGTGTRVVNDLVKSRQLLGSSAFASRIGWTRQALHKAQLANRVFYLESGGERFYPAFFADDRYQRHHLEAVAKLLGDLPGGAKWLFFTTPKGSLSRRTPLHALEKGQLAQVKTAAEGFAER